MRAPRLDTHHVDLAGFEAWLRGQLVGPAFSAVIVVVVQMIRALFQQNTKLRARIQGRRIKPPSEVLDVVERQLSFAFAIPSNDVSTTASSEATAASSAAADEDEATKKKRAKPRPRQPLPSHLAIIDVPNDVPAHQRVCDRCDTTMTTVGFGDITPKTDLGRRIASVMMLLGWGTLAVPTGIVTAEMTARRMGPVPTTRTCQECLSEGHLPEATFCQNCGARLPPYMTDAATGR